ncbi:hypothetical protein BHE74_00020924 [Ensete ventricosum]|nr:hypothetical protein BHE74_00020924 [Ensete ventricosum]
MRRARCYCWAASFPGSRAAGTARCVDVAWRSWRGLWDFYYTILIPIQEDLLSRVSAVPMPTSELESNSLHRPLANDANLCSSSCHYSLHSVSNTVGEMAESTPVEMR